jgi:tryptophan synthase alpha chain
MTLENNRLVKAFAKLRSEGKKTLLPFVTAGYPDLQTTSAILSDLESRGVRICELGIPFSDPVADGPVIQASYTAALAGGLTSVKIFDMVREFRSRPGNQQLALVAMVSYSIVFRHGVGRYFKDAAEAGFDGMIIPDLPMEEAETIEPLASAAGLANILLISPTTPEPRRLAIARHSRGFVYYMSIAGITGERTALPEATTKAVAELRTHTDAPICVGFGVSNAKTVAEVCKVADGAIVGSAIVHRITEAIAKGLPREKIVAGVGEFVAELLEPVK